MKIKTKKEIKDYTFDLILRMVAIVPAYYLSKGVKLSEGTGNIIVEISKSKWKLIDKNLFEGINVMSNSELDDNTAVIKVIDKNAKSVPTNQTDEKINHIKVLGGEISKLELLFEAIEFREDITFWKADFNHIDYESEDESEVAVIAIKNSEEFNVLETIYSLGFKAEEMEVEILEYDQVLVA